MIIIFALAVGLGIFIIFLGLARTPTVDTARMVQQRLQVYGAGGEARPLTVEEGELQRPVTERFLRPALVRPGSIMSPSTPPKQRPDLQNKPDLAGRARHLAPEDFC